MSVIEMLQRKLNLIPISEEKTEEQERRLSDLQDGYRSLELLRHEVDGTIAFENHRRNHRGQE